MADPSVTLFGPIDELLGPGRRAAYLLLVLLLVNMVTRKLATDRYHDQAEDGPEAISRSPVHVASDAVLVLVSLYYTTLAYHSGVVLSTIVLTIVIADFFEFEARKVEAREGHPLEAPRSAIAASLIALAYALYLTLFFLVKPLWTTVV